MSTAGKMDHELWNVNSVMQALMLTLNAGPEVEANVEEDARPELQEGDHDGAPPALNRLIHGYAQHDKPHHKPHEGQADDRYCQPDEKRRHLQSICMLYKLLTIACMHEHGGISRGAIMQAQGNKAVGLSNCVPSP